MEPRGRWRVTWFLLYPPFAAHNHWMAVKDQVRLGLDEVLVQACLDTATHLDVIADAGVDIAFHLLGQRLSKVGESWEACCSGSTE